VFCLSPTRGGGCEKPEPPAAGAPPATADALHGEAALLFHFLCLLSVSGGGWEIDPAGWCRAGDGDGHGSGLAGFPSASSSFSLLTSPFFSQPSAR
jgi:hypothetical protein